ncbi:MAG: 3-deoxy-8-phosphooctulonate synthase [Phycisphaerae bacterium]|nr:3-deoxy-8-phosphooctulonate synthase [Phycisphaerae bacterium]
MSVPAYASPLRAFFERPASTLLVIAGPCVLEDDETNRTIGRTVRDACTELGWPYVFKASFDKANRTSIRSHRGPGASTGLERLRRLRDELQVPVTTDIHEPSQAQAAAAAADILQIPAFLCRQTDLLRAAADTGQPVNVKKGQFLSPEEMKSVMQKLREGGCRHAMVTERGTFFGYHRLVNDFVGLGDLRELGVPVCFDASHSTQLPGAAGTSSGGRPERTALLARAAVAAGIDAIFLECHPEPARASSDSSIALRLSEVRPLLGRLHAIRAATGADLG